MPLPAFFPHPRYVPRLAGKGALPLEALCAQAGTGCAAIGPWTQRPIVLKDGGSTPWIAAEPGDWGVVHVGVPSSRTTGQARAQWALGALAYVLFDGVARASIAGASWAKVERPPGAAPANRRARSVAERQRALRARVRDARAG